MKLYDRSHICPLFATVVLPFSKRVLHANCYETDQADGAAEIPTKRVPFEDGDVF